LFGSLQTVLAQALSHTCLPGSFTAVNGHIAKEAVTRVWFETKP